MSVANSNLMKCAKDNVIGRIELEFGDELQEWRISNT